MGDFFCNVLLSFCRCFLSGGSPACSPSKSRVFEALCIHLCDKFSTPQKEGRYISHWKLILSAYNGIRQSLLNSEDLLAGTYLILPIINEATLTKWYKDHTRSSEIKMLLQGLSLPGRTLATEPLDPPKERPLKPALPEAPMQFEEPSDTTGQAAGRVRLPLPPVGVVDEPLVPGGEPSVELKDQKPATSKPRSRTTEWRHRKKSGQSKERKVYTCRVCDRPHCIRGTHSYQMQTVGYCPHAPGQIQKAEWLLLRKAEAAEKKA